MCKTVHLTGLQINPNLSLIKRKNSQVNIGGAAAVDLADDPGDGVPSHLLQPNLDTVDGINPPLPIIIKEYTIIPIV